MKRQLNTPYPEFDANFFGVSALSLPLPVSMPISIPIPILHERLFPNAWVPGLNIESEQARGLITAFPMWD